MSKKNYDVYIPDGHKVTKAEREAAWILADHYRKSVQFLRPSNQYMTRTADFIINDIKFELKSPTSIKIKNVKKSIYLASEQSPNIVVDMRKTKMSEDRMINICETFVKNSKKLNKILLIVNKKKIIDFSK